MSKGVGLVSPWKKNEDMLKKHIDEVCNPIKEDMKTLIKKISALVELNIQQEKTIDQLTKKVTLLTSKVNKLLLEKVSFVSTVSTNKDFKIPLPDLITMDDVK